MIELILMAHVFFGVICLITAMWLFAETFHASETNQSRIKKLSCIAATAMWLSFLVAGYWYVAYYRLDKNIILKGPWPFAHNLVMETKEHLVISLLLLASFLPIVACNKPAANNDARRLLLWCAGATVMMALLMEGEGAIIAMGVKVALLAK